MEFRELVRNSAATGHPRVSDFIPQPICYLLDEPRNVSLVGVNVLASNVRNEFLEPMCFAVEDQQLFAALVRAAERTSTKKQAQF